MPSLDLRALLWTMIATTSRLAIPIVMLCALAACSDADRAIKARLASPARLSQDDIARTLEATGRAMGGRTPRVRQGGVARPLTEKERAQVFDVLADPRGLDDVGLQHIGEATVRGLRVPATSPQSEIDATGTIWIDVATLLPRRYEFAYVMPGFGDVALDLTFDTTP
jgi:hypothetical protein